MSASNPSKAMLRPSKPPRTRISPILLRLRRPVIEPPWIADQWKSVAGAKDIAIRKAACQQIHKVLWIVDPESLADQQRCQYEYLAKHPTMPRGFVKSPRHGPLKQLLKQLFSSHSNLYDFLYKNQLIT